MQVSMTLQPELLPIYYPGPLAASEQKPLVAVGNELRDAVILPSGWYQRGFNRVHGELGFN